MKLLIVFLLLLAPCAAQEPCDLKLNQSPAVQGLRLEMSPEEVQSVLGLKVKVSKKTGEGVFFQNFIKDAPPASLNGVRAIYLRFFDRKLYQIEIFYESRAEWQTLDDFLNSFAAKLNLANLEWQSVKGKRQIVCDGFTIAADNVLNPRIELTDNAGRARFDDAKKQKSNNDD
jgi:hypothetical protein